MRQPGEILLVACYELGHQPLSVAWPAAFLERAGYAPAVMDLSVEPFDAEKVTRARLVAIAVPMHTALRLGVIAAKRIRTVNPPLTSLLRPLRRPERRRAPRHACADTVLAGEMEDQLVDLVRRLEAGERVEPGAARRANAVLSERASPGSTRSPAGAARRARQAGRSPCRHATRCRDQEVRARGARRPARSRGVRGGQPRLQAPLPALPDSARLRRPLLRGPGGDGAGRRAPAGGGRRRAT